jgi:methionine synthase II (cobalamin-independent)
MTGMHVHLVGSVGLDSTQDVFATVGKLLGEHLLRVPDGEPGGRRMWINWQFPLLRGLAFLQPDWDQKPAVTGCLPLKLVDGTKPEDIHFGELGYAREARTSYQDFLAARANGILPKGIRFQVCLPTPFAVLGSLVRREDSPKLDAAYEDAMTREVQAICAAIPHEDLCVQWDICLEMLAFDGRSFIRSFPGMETYFGERFARLSNAVPAEVELGFHLCYGDLDGKHSLDPADSAKLRDMMHLIIANVRHPIAYFHMPVPIDRSDDAYFAPLADLKLGAGTELFLGLVHVKDGVAGSQKRIAAARKYVKTFGIASECGISRARTPELVAESLRVHAAVAEG